MTQTWVLVVPIGQREQAQPGKARSVGPLGTVGFFSNNKQNATEIQKAIADWMSETLDVKVRFYRKLNASVQAEPALIEQIARECDAVITGSADCGSCTSSAVHDSETLRGRGLPVGMLTSDRFVDLAQMQADALGAELLDAIVVRHPIGGISPGELTERCSEAIDQTKLWWERVRRAALVVP